MKNSNRGSALLATLMVMVGLSLLGLGFVAISETESSISVNQRNATQTQVVAEAGVKLVIEWFQDPIWAEDQGLLPANSAAITPARNLIIAGATYNGRYRSDGSRLFDLPFKPDADNRFWGSEGSPDVVIDATHNQAFLNTLNATLFSTTAEGGRITDIRVYAPPMSGATLNANGYWEGGVRLGLATVQVTATKCRNDSAATPCLSNDDPDRLIAQKTARAVLSEWPFPGPSGPIQTNADLGTNGDLQVHWGKITATGQMTLKNPFGALPWHDATNKLAFHYGYVSAAVDDPWPTNTASTNFKEQHDWVYEILGVTLQDPWYEAWARDSWQGDGAGIIPYFPFKYNDPLNQAIFESAGGGKICDVCRSIFQGQTIANHEDRKDVLFPNVEYEFWKEVAISGDDQDTVFYLRYDAASGNFRDRNGTLRSVLQWIDLTQGAIPGFYFFDSANGLNPQDGGPGILTPPIKVTGWSGQMAGFIYFNTAKWDASGGAGGGPPGRFNMPGEPYKDLGFWQLNATNTDYQLNAMGQKTLVNPRPGRWDYLDINGDEEFTFVLETRTFNRANGAPGSALMPKSWYPTCVVGTNCSEPHEPYLNYIYPEDAIDDVTVGWQATATRRAKVTDTGVPSGTAITCTAASTQEECTSNAYDRDGGLVELEPVLNGVMYVEGEFEQTGNMHYFGSVLVEGDAAKSGTPDVWFDERLIKGEWPPREFNFPRVFISSLQTD